MTTRQPQQHFVLDLIVLSYCHAQIVHINYRLKGYL